MGCKRCVLPSGQRVDVATLDVPAEKMLSRCRTCVLLGAWAAAVDRRLTDGRNHLVDKAAQGRRVLENDLKVTYPYFDQEVDLADRLGRGRA
jgi:hypothetical protein